MNGIVIIGMLPVSVPRAVFTLLRAIIIVVRWNSGLRVVNDIIRVPPGIEKEFGLLVGIAVMIRRGRLVIVLSVVRIRWLLLRNLEDAAIIISGLAIRLS